MTSEHNEQDVSRPDVSAAERTETPRSTGAPCPELDTLVTLGTASEWQLAMLQHVVVCTQCRTRWLELANVRDAFDESLPIPAAFDDRVIAAIAAQVTSHAVAGDDAAARRRRQGELFVHSLAAGLTTFIALAPLTRPGVAVADMGGFAGPLLPRIVAALLIGSLALIVLRRLPSGLRPT